MRLQCQSLRPGLQRSRLPTCVGAVTAHDCKYGPALGGMVPSKANISAVSGRGLLKQPRPRNLPNNLTSMGLKTYLGVLYNDN